MSTLMRCKTIVNNITYKLVEQQFLLVLSYQYIWNNIMYLSS